MISQTLHIDAMITVPLALIVACGLIWYWFRVGTSRTPRACLIARRLSMVILVLSLPTFVRGLSFVDPEVDPSAYLSTWLVAIATILLVIVISSTDALMVLRFHQQLDVDNPQQDPSSDSTETSDEHATETP